MELITSRKIISFWIICMIVFNLSFSSQGQDKFSNNMDVFIEELDDFISLSSDDEVKNISKNFVKIFRKKSLTNEEKNKTRNIIEALYKRNLKADPYYKSFLSLVKVFWIILLK